MSYQDAFANNWFGDNGWSANSNWNAHHPYSNQTNHTAQNFTNQNIATSTTPSNNLHPKTINPIPSRLIIPNHPNHINQSAFNYHQAKKKKIDELAQYSHCYNVNRGNNNASSPHQQQQWQDMDMTLWDASKWPGRQAIDEFMQNMDDGAIRAFNILLDSDAGGYRVDEQKRDARQRILYRKYDVVGISNSDEVPDRNGNRFATVFFGIVGTYEAANHNGGYNSIEKREKLLGHLIIKKKYIIGSHTSSAKFNGKWILSSLSLTNYCSQLNPFCLTAGASGEEKRKKEMWSPYKGHFGDGLRSAIRYFEIQKEKTVEMGWQQNESAQLRINTCGYTYNFGVRNKSVAWSSNSKSRHKTLHFRVSFVDDSGNRYLLLI